LRIEFGTETRASAEKFTGERKAIERRPRNITNKPPSILSVASEGTHWAVGMHPGPTSKNPASSAPHKK